MPPRVIKRDEYLVGGGPHRIRRPSSGSCGHGRDPSSSASGLVAPSSGVCDRIRMQPFGISRRIGQRRAGDLEEFLEEHRRPARLHHPRTSGARTQQLVLARVSATLQQPAVLLQATLLDRVLVFGEDVLQFFPVTRARHIAPWKPF